MWRAGQRTPYAGLLLQGVVDEDEVQVLVLLDARVGRDGPQEQYGLLGRRRRARRRGRRRLLVAGVEGWLRQLVLVLDRVAHVGRLLDRALAERRRSGVDVRRAAACSEGAGLIMIQIMAG